MFFLEKETEHPDGDVVVSGDFRVVASVDQSSLLAAFVILVAYTYLLVFVNVENAGFLAYFHGMKPPNAIDKECFHEFLLCRRLAQDTVKQVGIVHEYACGLFGSVAVGAVYLVNQTRFLQIVHVIHDRGTGSLDFLSQITYIWRVLLIDRQEVKQLFQTGKILHVDLLDEENVYLKHRIQILQQLFCEVVAILV